MKRFRAFCIGVVVLAATVATAATPALAEVIIRNGDFRLVQTDLGEHEGDAPRVTRYYHSTWKVEGMFGSGWLSEYELTVERGERDTLLVMDPCSGKPMRYLRAPAGVSQGAPFSEGAVYRGSRCGCQTITTTREGYLRKSGDRVETYDPAGKLVRVQQGQGYTVDVVRNAAGQIVALVDSKGCRLNFTFDGPRVSQVTRDGEVLVDYGYRSGRLASVTPGENEGGQFRYDSGGLLTRYTTGSSDETITYLTGGATPRVGTHTYAYGAWERYSYEDGSPDGLTHATTVTSGSGSGEYAYQETTLHLFTEQRNEAGELWLSEEVEVQNGKVMGVSRYSSSGLPLETTSLGETTRRTYDSNDRLTRKESPTETVELSYDQKSGKVSQVRRSSHNGELILETTYSYDSKGNLLQVRDSSGTHVVMQYNHLDQIESLDDGSRILFIKYGPAGKPTRLEIPGVGSIEVSYDEKGVIQEVHGDQGREISLQITDAFRVLLDLVREAQAGE
ncbi:DUF6531 domain-containing protein [Geomonas paludis]|uniref:DUF6531 domain-containing protein n=1 Tax=Geomonas paludis TaxID=2740185 RepID=A0A6V8MSY9_9BACT|nr:DUF6531 domain-containing protein [Geomonas paludis]UPU38210.1 DUF6531 domain-containing protein [Geomonas paludis]GFO63258.1 hypothetical protein GMPD_11770 [Geomonas paludis]